MLVLSRESISQSAVLLDDTDIATLPDRTIRAMTRQELLTVIRSCHEHPRHCDSESHVAHYDEATLLRLTFLVRRCCRKRVANCDATGTSLLPERI